VEVEKGGKKQTSTAHQQAQRENRRLREEIAQTKESLQAIRNCRNGA
jgi:hypothetical protein